MWLSGKQYPDFRTINKFRSSHLKDSITTVFKSLLLLMFEEGYIHLDEYYCDGTTIQADANKHKVIWKKNTARFLETVEVRIEATLVQIDELNDEENAQYGDNDLEIQGNQDTSRKDRIQESVDKLNLTINETAPFSAAWESFVAMQLFAYIDVNISWSCLKGLLSLVDGSGMLGGESLPSRKAHSAWVLYELSKDLKSLSEVYPAISRYLNWRLLNPRWIYTNMTPENEKDAEFVVSAIKDLEYMGLIANELGLKEDAKEWDKKKGEFVEQYKQWFWKTPQDLPCQHINHFKGRDTHPIQITTGLYVNELTSDYFESLLGLFYKYYDTDASFAGFNAPKYPDVDFTVYGLIEKGKDILARGIIEANLRDIIRAHGVYAETYTNDPEPQPGGVRPSIFGLAAMIDFTLLKNGYMFTKGTPTAINIYPESSVGVKNIPYLGKHIDIHKDKYGTISISGSALENIKTLKLKRGEMKGLTD